VTHDHLDHLDVNRSGRLGELNTDLTVLAQLDAKEKLIDLRCDFTLLEDGGVLRTSDITLTGVGSSHAVIHRDLPPSGNTGILVEVESGLTLFHPGDSYDATPGDVDILALPMSAPWAKLGETIDFLRRIAPSFVFPIHDRALTESGYPIYWRLVENLGGSENPILLTPEATYSF
jgi:L-ascorbate metabolism protein UlaG (beta-lactamase superfamily)